MKRIAPISVSLAFRPRSCACTEMLHLGADHLVALCVSLPCSFPKRRTIRRKITGAIFRSLAWLDQVSNPELCSIKSENSTTGPRVRNVCIFLVLYQNTCNPSYGLHTPDTSLAGPKPGWVGWYEGEKGFRRRHQKEPKGLIITFPATSCAEPEK